jgi:hypothetical protein
MGDDLQMKPIEIRNGVETSEFSATTVAAIVNAVIAGVALIHPGFTVPKDTQELIVTVAMTVIALVTAVYSHGRAQVKQAAINANADVQTAAVQATAPVYGAHFPGEVIDSLTGSPTQGE